MAEQNPNNQQKPTTFTEEIELAGNQLVDRVQEVLQQGNVRRIVIRTADDRVLLDTTLTIGAVVGGAVALFWWPLAAIAAIAGAVAKVKVEIVREVVDAELPIPGGKAKVEIQNEE